MKKILIIGILLMSLNAMAQDSLNYSWTDVIDYKIGSREAWAVDGLENVYVSKKTTIDKYDSVGVLKFSQSIKSLGRMKQLVPVNTMKLVHFSEEQQTLCYLDNTLTSLDDCIELSNLGVINAILISSSNQPDKIWVLDNINSRLLLIPMEGTNPPQEIMNIRGILDLNEIDQIAERGNHLLLLDAEKGTYVFDVYGTLITLIPEVNVSCVDANEQTIFMLRDNQLIMWSLDNEETLTVDLPIKGVIDFRYKNHYLFLRTMEAVHKFRLQFSE